MFQLGQPQAIDLFFSRRIGSYYDNDRRDTSPFTADELLGRSFIVKYTRLVDDRELPRVAYLNGNSFTTWHVPQAAV